MKIASYFGAGTGNIYLYNLNCLGNEESVTSCTNTEAVNPSCDHEEDVGIVCYGNISFV